MADGEAAILAAIKEINTTIRDDREWFRRQVDAAYVNLARSDEVQSVKASVNALSAKLSSMPSREDCDNCRKNFVDKRTFLGGVGGLGLLGAVAASYDKIKSLF